MNTPVITKHIDELGRIVIPKPVRKALGVNNGDPVDFILENEGITLKKHSECCIFCSSSELITEFGGKYICAACKKAISDK